MQSINLLLSSDPSGAKGSSGPREPRANLIFVLGLDREVVAAGLGAKYENILPYLAGGRLPPGATAFDLYRVGIDYGYAFLEKFIQVPFRVPALEITAVRTWMSGLIGTVEHSGPAVSADRISQIHKGSLQIGPGVDPEGFDRIVVDVAGIFAFNPRRIKQFVNVFRLHVMIALQTGLLAPSDLSAKHSEPTQQRRELSISQIGIVTAILLRWPALITDLADDPDLLGRLASEQQDSTGAADAWGKNEQLRRALKLGAEYSLSEVDIRPILQVLPSIYSAGIRRSDGPQPRPLA